MEAISTSLILEDSPEACQAVLERHARSFRIAARLLGKREAEEAALCYAFCRLADDLVDNAPSLAQGEQAIAQLKAELIGDRVARPLVASWRALAVRRNIPLSVGIELVDAIASDTKQVRIQDDSQLFDYAYGVAGTVGRMMCGILGARGEQAELAAVALGKGMQLTNIARDVGEDADRDRVYLPANRLLAAGVDPDAVANRTADATRTFRVVQELIALAEGQYQLALTGFSALPFRSRLAVAVAAGLYRAIGLEVARRGTAALRSRTVLSSWQLCKAFAQGLAFMVHVRG